MQTTADLLAVRVCFTFEPAFFYPLTANSKKFCLVHKDLITTYLLMIRDHFCFGVCAVAVKGSRVPTTILCIQSDINCRKTALQRFAEAVSKWANMPAAQLAPLLALTSLSANYSLSVGNKPEHLIFLLWKMDHSPFPDFLWVDGIILNVVLYFKPFCFKAFLIWSSSRKSQMPGTVHVIGRG